MYRRSKWRISGVFGFDLNCSTRAATGSLIDLNVVRTILELAFAYLLWLYPKIDMLANADNLKTKCQNGPELFVVHIHTLFRTLICSEASLSKSGAK